MRKVIVVKMIRWGLIVVLLTWPAFHIFQMMSSDHEQGNAEQLLFQVALFQMELLSGSLNEATSAKDTAQLNALKQAVYAMKYTHERLVQVMGGKAPKLTSLNEFMQVVVRLQIGGQRPLKSEELALLRKLNQSFQELYTSYGKLMTSNGKIVASSVEQIDKLDAVLIELLHKKLLE